ncbi:hypothetical protein FACS1894137_08140 [Spirochaetia bacterium]|nr:hypothetical protein FACS1894137_08140 [Spirochaetia bacterium]
MIKFENCTMYVVTMGLSHMIIDVWIAISINCARYVVTTGMNHTIIDCMDGTIFLIGRNDGTG